MKISSTKADLIQSLKNQLLSLEDLCGLYDAGKEHIYQDIAVKIRVISHNSNTSKSLIKQLKLEHLEFYNSAYKYRPSNLMSHTGLIGIKASGGSARYYSPLGDTPMRISKVSQEYWWNSAKVIVDSKKIAFTRRQLILEVANTDGGAHVDDGIKEDYYNLTRLNSCSWKIEGPNGVVDFESPVPASVRQIAWEVLESFRDLDISKESKLHH